MRMPALSRTSDLPPTAGSLPPTSEVAPPRGIVPAYDLLAPAQAMYDLIDSTHITLQSSDQPVEVFVAARATAELDLRPAGDDVRGGVRVTALAGTGNTYAGSSVNIGADEIPDVAEVIVSRHGQVRIVKEPAFSDELRKLMGPNRMYQSFFARLPGREILRGAKWTDTISISDENQGLVSRTLRIVTSVWDRDTTIAGRVLNVIESRSIIMARVRGSTPGVEIEQNLAGESTSTTLWHSARRLIYEHSERASLSGSTDLPSAGLRALPTSATTWQMLRLRN